MATAESVSVTVREVTDAEVTHFHEQGWVVLRELLPRAVADRLLARAEEWMGDDGTAHERRDGVDFAFGADRTYYRPSASDEVFRAVATHPALGRSTARLLGRESAISLQGDMLRIKAPADKGTGPTGFHQDSTYTPADRSMITIWIALAEVRPEQGSLQFFSGSHRLGKLGDVSGDAQRAAWPTLMACERSEPPHLQPGDATVHIDTMVHGATENLSSTPRWSWIVHTWPADALYTGQPSPITDGLGLEYMRPMIHENFPVIYTP